MHTDGHAMEHLKNEIGNSIENFNISNVPFDFQDQVLQLLTGIFFYIFLFYFYFIFIFFFFIIFFFFLFYIFY